MTPNLTAECPPASLVLEGSRARAQLGNYAPPQLTESRSSCSGVNSDDTPEARSSRWECFPEEQCDVVISTLTASNCTNPNGRSSEDEADPAVFCGPFIVSAAVCGGSALCSPRLLLSCVLLFGGSLRLPGRITCS